MHNYHLINLIKDELDISLVSIYDKVNTKYLQKSKIRYFNVKLPFQYIFDLSSKLKILGNFIRSLKDWLISKQMYKAYFNFNSEIVEFMDIHSEGYYFLKNRKNKFNIKVIIRSHTPWSLLKKYYSKEEIKNVDSKWSFERELFCFKNCDFITTPSNDLKIQLKNLFNLKENKIIVIPNIIDTDHFKPLKKRNEDNKFVLLHIGRFERSKGVETLIKSFIKIAMLYDDVYLVNVGKVNPDTFIKCKKLLNEKNLETRVTFENFINYNDLPNFYKNCDLVIVASEVYESFSYTVAQAMSCGRAVIGSNIGGIPETLDFGRAGLLFEPGNVNSLEESIKKVYLKKIDKKLLEYNARRFIIDNFSYKVLKSRYLDLYQGQIKLKK